MGVLSCWCKRNKLYISWRAICKADYWCFLCHYLGFNSDKWLTWPYSAVKGVNSVFWFVAIFPVVPRIISYYWWHRISLVTTWKIMFGMHLKLTITYSKQIHRPSTGIYFYIVWNAHLAGQTWSLGPSRSCQQNLDKHQEHLADLPLGCSADHSKWWCTRLHWTFPVGQTGG